MKKKFILLLVLGIVIISVIISIVFSFTLFRNNTKSFSLNIPELSKAPVIKVLTMDTMASQQSESKFDIKDNPYVRYIFQNTGINFQLQ